MSLDPITSVIDLVSTVVSRIWPDKTEQEKEAFMTALQAELDATTIAKAQIDTNTAEAASSSLFVAGWRPAIGWICAVAFGYAYIIQPLVLLIASAVHHPLPEITLDLSTMMPVLMGMLGLGGLRSFEKLKNVHDKH